MQSSRRMITDAKENTEFTSGLNHVSAEGRQHGMEFGYVKQAGKGRAPGQLLLAVGVSTGTRLRGCDLLRYSLATLFAHSSNNDNSRKSAAFVLAFQTNARIDPEISMRITNTNPLAHTHPETTQTSLRLAIPTDATYHGRLRRRVRRGHVR